MKENKEMNTLKLEIEKKRNELNCILLMEEDRERIVKFSQELDLLINQFYQSQVG